MIVLLFFSCSGVFATPFNQIIFFGDSLTDNGNLHKLLLKIVPKSPPYFKGRFSNGEVWAEHVGKFFYDNYYIDYKDYAYGGATAVLHLPNIHFIAPSNLEIEVNRFIIDQFFRDKSTTLFSIWIGANDYFYYHDGDPDYLTTQAVNRVAWAINHLIYFGARYFLVLNLPGLDETPYAKSHGMVPLLHFLTQLHNQKLAEMVDEIKNKNPGVNIVYIDTNSIFHDFVMHPDKYNKKYHGHVTNTEDACWKGGYLMRGNNTSKEALDSQLRRTLTTAYGAIPENTDTKAMSEFILNSPMIYRAYMMGQSFDRGILPCPDANEYAFWDDMHPSEIVHRILAQIVVSNVKKAMFD